VTWLAVLAALALLAAAVLGGIGLRRGLSRLQRWLSGTRAQQQALFRAVAAARDLPDISTVRSPIIVATLDPERSPATGFGRAAWREVTRRLLDGVLQHSHGLTRPLRFPASPLAGYPRLGDDGRIHGETESYMEAVCRSLWLAAPLLGSEPTLRSHGRDVAGYYREYIVRGASANDAASFGRGRGDRPSQHSVEAASLCAALTLAPEALWTPMSPQERERVLDWLDHCRALPVHDNNWRWFSIILNTFLKQQGRRPGESAVRGHLAAIDRMYADAGWYRDGQRFDFYAGWAMQFYPLLWAQWDGDSFPADRDQLYERNDLFLESYPHLFSRRGEMPLWGRSVTYRFAAAAPLAAAFLRPSAPAIDPGFARRLASGCLKQFLTHPEFLQHGIPSLGFQGPQAAVIDPYSGVASPLWCAKLCIALSLPDDSPFWMARENDGFWEDPPQEYRIGSTGLRVTHDRASGHSRLFAPQSSPSHDARYDAPWFDTADAVYPAPPSWTSR
jgi:hypothetical protein